MRLLILLSSFLQGRRIRSSPFKAYSNLFEGAFGSVRGIVFTIVAATPLILAGMAVGLGFKAGLFNIGAQGQFLLGALGAARRRRRGRRSVALDRDPGGHRRRRPLRSGVGLHPGCAEGVDRRP